MSSKRSVRQLVDLETILYFVPAMYSRNISEAAKSQFLEFSERGIVPTEPADGYKALLEGKRWRGIHMRMYEEGLLEGSVPYAVLLEGMSRAIVAFMKKELFEGQDAKLIETVYADILNSNADLQLGTNLT